MPDAYPYIISNNKVEPILGSIRQAARPERFSRKLLQDMGYTASNDRAIISVLKGLGFLDDNGVSREDYDRLRDSTLWRGMLGEKVRELYSDLYAINTSMHNADDDEIKGAIVRVTGKD